MEKTITLLEKLVKLPGIPGREKQVAEFLLSYPLGSYKRSMDISGNTWIECEGSEKPPLVLVAHIDEIGCRVKKIEEDGRISVIGIENIDLRTLAGQVFQIWTGDGAVHDAYVYLNQKTTKPDDYKDLKEDGIRLELGLCSRAETESLGIRPNDPVTFGGDFVRLKGNMLCAKAFDNRASVAAILRALELSMGRRRQRAIFLGTVQEEIGGHGAYAVHFEEKPGGVLIIDICGAEVFKLKENERRTIMGKGPILLDHPGTNQGFSRRLEELAVQNSIPFQRVGYYWRGADPSILQQKCGGLATMTIIIPMAYYHAPKGLINAIDVFNTARLLEAVLTDEEFLNFSSTF